MENNNLPPTPPITPPAPEPTPAAVPEPTPMPMPEPVPPQPTVQPVEPAAVPFDSPIPQPAKKPQTKLILIIVAAIVGLGALLAAFFVFIFPMISISAQDYTDAYDAYSTARSSSYDVSSVYISTYATETEIRNDAAKLSTAIETFRGDMNKLKDLKVYKGDSKARELFDALLAKSDKAIEAADVALEAYSEFLPGLAKFQKASSSDADSLLKNVSELKSVFIKANLNKEINKDFATAMTSAIAGLETAIQDYSAAAKAYEKDWRNNPYPSTSGVYDAQDKISDALKDWQSNLEKLTDDGDVRREAEALEKYLIDNSK